MEPMSVQIRPATTADLDDLVVLNGDIQALHHQTLPHLFKPAKGGSAVKELFGQLLGDAANIVLVAIANETVAGYLFCERRERAETALTYASCALYIHHLGVSAEHRRQGIGRALMSAAQSFATESGISRIEVDFWTFNDEARAFYAAQGFVSFNERWWRG
jgi:ribosomal protein S18 acetylase RimI-like enzyme